MRQLTASLLTAAALALASTTAVLAWGAIAVDDAFGDEPSGIGYGFATELASRQEASAGAMDACKSEEGNTDCKVVLVFKACGAYAASRTNFGVGTGGNLGTAEKRAMSLCGDGDCIVVVSGCE